MPEDPLGPVTIGVREIYDKLLDLSSKVDRVADAYADTRTVLTDHEARLRALEKGRWPLPSLAAVISLGSLALAVVSLIRGG